MVFVEFENLNQKNSNTFFYNIINRCVNKWNRMNVCSAAAPALAAGAIVNCVHTIQKHIHLCSIQLQNAFAVPCNMILHFKMHLANQQVWVCVCVRMYVCLLNGFAFTNWMERYVCVCAIYKHTYIDISICCHVNLDFDFHFRVTYSNVIYHPSSSENLLYKR